MARPRGIPFGILIASLFIATPPPAVWGQSEDLQLQIRESQRRLEEIRQERERLQAEMEAVRTGVRDASAELQNVERRLSTSRAALSEIEFQVSATAERIQATQGELIGSREKLRESSAVLNRRLRDIYKLGPLHTVRVLLGAQSFADLLNRYRYLRLVAAYDRNLVQSVTLLESTLSGQAAELQESMAQLGQLRQTKVTEVAELRSLEAEHASALERFELRGETALSRLEQLEIDEGRLTDLVAELERRRIEAESRRAIAGEAATPNSLSTDDAGALDWPVDGELVYRFGRETRPNGTILRWNGLGIAGEPGAPVRAVRGGTVVMAGPFEGYGPSVVLSHGGGFFTLYLYLADVGVVEGREVEAGQVVGTVGGLDTPEGPHIEFQIRAPIAGGAPQARDPLQWLKPRGGG